MKKRCEWVFAHVKKLKLLFPTLNMVGLACCLLLSLEGFSQEKRFTFQMKQVAVADVFLYLEKNSDYSFVYNPGRDYSRIRKLSPDHVISFLISQGASSTKCEFLDFFQMSEDLPSISALNQRRSQMMPEALEAVFHEFTSSSEKLELSKQEQQYQYIAAEGSTTSFFSFSKYSSDHYFISEGHSASGFYTLMPFMT